jgi:hypothetical protein
MPDTLLRKVADGELARDAGTKLKDGLTNNRTEMFILLGTVGFVIVMALLGIALLSAS